MELSVHFLENHDREYVDQLRAQLDDRIKLTVSEELKPSPDYHILIAGVFSEHHLTASPNLHTVIIPWTGLPRSSRDHLLKHPRLAVYNQHYNAIAVAESAAGLMLAAARRLIPVDRAFRRHDWTVRYGKHQSLLLHGKTTLLLGYGAIGRAIGNICRGLGMNLLATRRQADQTEPDVEIHPPDRLHDLLPRAHVLHITLPLTPETDGLLGSHELALLPDRAIIVNVGRGLIIDEAALFNELKSGRLHAGLDVWYNYPREEQKRTHTPPSQFPFHELDNVVMTPHMAEHALETESAQIAELASMLNAAAENRPIPNRVYPERGY